MPPKKTAPEAGATPDFETSLKRLEEIVDQLESGELSLEDSIARYEEGVKLSRGLTARLDEAEKRIERLVDDAGAGAPGTEPMDVDDDDSATGELPF